MKLKTMKVKKKYKNDYHATLNIESNVRYKLKGALKNDLLSCL